MSSREQCLVEGCCHPYRKYPGVSWESAQNLLLYRMDTLRGAEVGVEGASTAVVSKLGWDTNILDIECGRVDLAAVMSRPDSHQLARLVVAEAERQGIEHLSARFDADDADVMSGFLSEGFEQVDSIETYVGPVLQLAGEEHIRLATPNDVKAVREIARTAFTVDRFHSDPYIEKDRADELHAVWGENSVLGKAADAVVIAEIDGEVLGFVTCKIQTEIEPYLGLRIGTIILVATAERARGRGFGTRMVRYAINWFYEHDCDLIEVGTQKSNVSACKLYESVGLTVRASSVSLRRMLGNPEDTPDVR